MNALENVLVDADFIPHYRENGDCQEPDDRNQARSRDWCELLQSAGGCQSERSRVGSELHCCQDEDEDEAQVIGCCHDQDDGLPFGVIPFIIASLGLLLVGLLDLVLVGPPFLG